MVTTLEPQAGAPPSRAEAEQTVTQAGERRSARIESLRALSALAVLLCHSYAFIQTTDLLTYHSRVILGTGFLGVDVFFALTGYLIFLPFARRDYGEGPRVDLPRYARNRALRILPLYYVVLAVVAVADHASGATVLRFALFGENFRQDLVAKVLDGPMWSLVVEVYFYLLLPALAWMLARLSRGSALRATGLLLILAGASVWFYEAGFQPNGVWVHSLPANFVYFVPGMLLALIRARRVTPALPRWLLRADLWRAAAVAIWLAQFVVVSWEFKLLPIATLGTFLVVGSCVLPVGGGTTDRLLDARPLAFLGVASYSLYLWHWPLLKWLPHLHPGWGNWFLFLTAATPVCLAAAVLSYRVIEYPLLRLRRRWFAGSPAPPG